MTSDKIINDQLANTLRINPATILVLIFAYALTPTTGWMELVSPEVDESYRNEQSIEEELWGAKRSDEDILTNHNNGCMSGV